SVCGRCERRVFPECRAAVEVRRPAAAGMEATLAAAAFAEEGEADTARRMIAEPAGDGSADARGARPEPASPPAAGSRRDGARGTGSA
ncbi:MAG TPA: hypothetical protein VIW03_16380, partial [Anaeromyxobacter sp.]